MPSADGSFLYVLLDDMRRRPRSDHMVLQRYSLDGQFHSEDAYDQSMMKLSRPDSPGWFKRSGDSGEVEEAPWTVEKLDR